MGWKGESRRHSLARKGIKTALPKNILIAKGEFFDKSFITPKGDRIYLKGGETHRDNSEGFYDKNYIRKTTAGQTGTPDYQLKKLDSIAIENIKNDIFTYPANIMKEMPIVIHESSTGSWWHIKGGIFSDNGFDLRKSMKDPRTQKVENDFWRDF